MLLIIFAHWFALGVAFAQETPILLERVIPTIGGWCGDNAVYFNRDLKHLTLLNVLTKQQTSLQVDQSIADVRGCSPNGNWALTDNGGWLRKEGGDPSCDPPNQMALPRLVLWNLQRHTKFLVGRGFAGFEWSPDGAILLYRFRPICDLEGDPRNSFKLPVGVVEFQAISAQTLIEEALGQKTDLPNQGRVGTFSWYANEAFIAQLPAEEGHLLGDDTRGGAIVAVHYHRGVAPRIEQLNPIGFQSSWKLPVPQVSPDASKETLKAADCEVANYRTGTGTLSSSILCRSRDEIRRTAFHFDPERYCRALSTPDAQEFCGPPPPAMYWQQIIRQSVHLVLRPVVSHQNSTSGIDLFRIDAR